LLLAQELGREESVVDGGAEHLHRVVEVPDLREHMAEPVVDIAVRGMSLGQFVRGAQRGLGIAEGCVEVGDPCLPAAVGYL
jgi:hypothetical protein